MKKILILLLAVQFITIPLLSSDPQRIPVISGYIRDASSGEALIGANIVIEELSMGTISNSYGFYSLSLQIGTYKVRYSYIGYTSIINDLELKSDTTIVIELEKDLRQIKEVVVRSEKGNDNITSVETGTIHLSSAEINRIPSLLGEVDLIKAIQLLPGVNFASEGSSGFSVRGGATDQNLIQLDEATVYNVSHLMGFFSVFNNDAIKDVKLYKGDIPAGSGGRLSSLLDIRMKDGNKKKFAASGGIGVLSSRLTMEGPLIKEKTSFIVSGRRTYADLFLPLSKDDEIRNNKLFFYDLNGKLSHVINRNNTLFISSYAGRDVFKNEYALAGFGNLTITARWNHLFSGKLFNNFSIIHSRYNYDLGSSFERSNSFRWYSELKDITAKSDLSYYVNPRNNLKAGLISTYHMFHPGTVKANGSNSLLIDYKLPGNYSLEHALYLSLESQISKRIGIKAGLRFSALQNIGKATVYNFDDSYNVIDSTLYDRKEIFNTHEGLEPRFGINIKTGRSSSVKAGYSRTMQYLQLAQNSTAGTPLDIWFSAGPNIKPQISDQLSSGFFKNFNNNKIETSAELYYKRMKNTIDFKEHAILLLNPLLEGEVRTGISTSYGMEFMIRLSEMRFSGWISYTLSKTQRVIEEINNGKPYPAPHDKPHNIAIVANYHLTKRMTAGLNWIYLTGSPVSFPTGRYEILGTVVPSYSDRNGYRLPDYHRLDLSLTISGKVREDKKWYGDWNFSVYNAYARKNAWSINFLQEENNPEITYAEKTYLFSVVPSVTYNFRFN